MHGSGWGCGAGGPAALGGSGRAGGAGGSPACATLAGMTDEQMDNAPDATDGIDHPERELLRVARIGRAQGMRGEVTVQVFTNEPEWRFEPGSVLWSEDGGTEYVVESSRTFKKRWIIKLEGCDDRDASEALNGTMLYGEADDPEDMLEADEWYPKDLIGLEARLAEGNGLGLPAGSPDAEPIGKVVDVIDGPAQDLLKIRLTHPVTTGTGKDGEPVVEKTALVPFVAELVPEIDPEGGFLTIDPPGGLIPGL